MYLPQLYAWRQMTNKYAKSSIYKAIGGISCACIPTLLAMALVCVLKCHQFDLEVERISKLLALEIGAQGLVVGTSGNEVAFVALLESDERVSVKEVQISSGARTLLDRTFALSDSFSVSRFFKFERKFRARCGDFVISGSAAFANREIILAALQSVLLIILGFFALLAFRRRQAIKSANLRAAINRQIAHDIRSPLTTLQFAIQKIDRHDENFELVDIACSRIRDIADELLQSEQSEAWFNLNSGKIEDIPSLISMCAVEKRTLYGQRSDLEILSINRNPELPLNAKIVRQDFFRAISNLIDNAAEAMNSGRITIETSAHHDQVIVTISDNGPGIPLHLLKHIGEKGKTFPIGNKTLGNGLGVYSAKKFALRSAGKLEIKSELGKGTKIELSFPKALPTAIPKVTPIVKSIYNVVLVDNDESIISLWKTAAKRNESVALRCFANSADLFKVIQTISSSDEIYVDSNLGAGAPAGIEIIKSLHELGYKNLHITTGDIPKNVQSAPWVKAVIGKSPPWL
jgi:signal transduction histidine kinase